MDPTPATDFCPSFAKIREDILKRSETEPPSGLFLTVDVGRAVVEIIDRLAESYYDKPNIAMVLTYEMLAAMLCTCTPASLPQDLVAFKNEAMAYARDGITRLILEGAAPVPDDADESETEWVSRIIEEEAA